MPLPSTGGVSENRTSREVPGFPTFPDFEARSPRVQGYTDTLGDTLADTLAIRLPRLSANAAQTECSWNLFLYPTRVGCAFRRISDTRGNDPHVGCHWRLARQCTNEGVEVESPIDVGKPNDPAAGRRTYECRPHHAEGRGTSTAPFCTGGQAAQWHPPWFVSPSVGCRCAACLPVQQRRGRRELPIDAAWPKMQTVLCRDRPRGCVIAAARGTRRGPDFE